MNVALAATASWLLRLLADRYDRVATQDALVSASAATTSGLSYGRTATSAAMCFNGVAEYVASCTLLDRKWANTTVVDGECGRSRAGPRRIGQEATSVHASISVTQALLTAGVVDELRLAITRVIADSERSPLDGSPTMRLELIEARRTQWLRDRRLPGSRSSRRTALVGTPPPPTSTTEAVVA